MRKKSKAVSIRRIAPVYLLMLPGLAYLAVNNYMPMFGLVIAFKNINLRKGILGSPWAGLSNFEFLFKTSDAWLITRNTMLYNMVFIVLGVVLSITVAILLNEIRSRIMSRLYQTLILLPYLMSMVIISYLAYALLSPENGFLNKAVLPMLGMEPVSWYQEKQFWPFILVFVHQWKSIGFSTVIYLASIIGISPDYYEAAMLDGAGKWQQIKNITLPLLKPTVITLFILNVGRIFYSDFGLFYQVPKDSGMLYSVTQTIDTYVYRGLMQQNNIAMSSAAGFYQSVVGFILVLAANGLVRRISRENALF